MQRFTFGATKIKFMPDSSNGRQSSVPEEWSGFFALRSNKTFLDKPKTTYYTISHTFKQNYVRLKLLFHFRITGQVDPDTSCHMATGISFIQNKEVG